MKYFELMTSINPRARFHNRLWSSFLSGTTLAANNGRFCLFIDIRTRESAILATIHGEDRPLLTSKRVAKYKQEENQENSWSLGENRKKSAENLLSGRLAE